MYEAEVHQTINKVQLLEKLSLDLDITEHAYRSEHELEGEIRVFTDPDSGVVRNRQAPPRTLLGPLVERALDSEAKLGSTYPGTRAFVGLSRDTPTSKDDDAFQELEDVDTVTIDGVPENGTLEVDADWALEEAERMLSSGETRVIGENYDIEGLPGDRLPLIVRADLYRDATTLAEKLDEEGERHGGHAVQRYEGKAALIVEIEHRDPGDSGRPFVVDRFRLELSRTFPDIEFRRTKNPSYDPEARQVEWPTRKVTPGEVEEFVIIGPISELVDIDDVTATFRGQLPGQSLTGMQIEGVFDESGSEFMREHGTVDQRTTVTCTAEMDPSALRGEVQETTNATVRVAMTPDQLYQRLRKICTANGIHIRDSDQPGEGTPVAGRDGVFEVTSDTADDEEGVGNAGWLRVSKEYGDRGVVYAEITVTGQFTAMSQEQEVSAFDETEDRIVRADHGGLDTRGEGKAAIKARSASSELNSELISTFERELEGGN